MKNNSKKIQIISRLPLFISFALLLVLFFVPVEQGWSSADSNLTNITLIISALALIGVFICRGRVVWCAIDRLLVGWWLFVVVSAYLPIPSLLFGKEVGLYPVASVVLRSSQMLALYLVLRVLMCSYRVRERYVAFGVVVASLCEALLALFQCFAGGSRHLHYSLTGTFFNPGSLGICVAVGVVALVALVRRYYFALAESKKCKIIEWIVFGLLTIMFAALAASWSRTAFLAVALCLLLMFRKWLKKYWWCVAIAAVAAGAFFYYIKQGSADGRAIIAAVSFGIFKQNVVLGTGIGSFFHQYAEQMAAYSPQLAEGALTNADVIEYPFNIFLRIGVEQGVVGLIFAFAFLFFLFNKCRTQCSILKWCLLSLVVSSCFSYVVELQPFQLILVVVISFVASQQKHFISVKRKRKLAPTIFCFFISVCFSLLSMGQVNKRVLAQAEYNEFRGQQDSNFLPGYYKILPKMSENSHFLFSFAKALREAGRFNDSNDMLRRGTLVSNDPMFYILQGNNYFDLDEPQLAEAMYCKAFAVMPNRLYPLYKLMLMYSEIGETEKALWLAERIQSFPEKVESAATRQMKQEALNLMNDTIYVE